MKLKAIERLCKRNKRVIVYTNPSGRQWLSDGRSIYDVSGLPPLDRNTVLELFEVPRDKREDFQVQEFGVNGDLLDDYAYGAALNECPFGIFVNGAARVYACEAKYLLVRDDATKPLGDLENEMYYYCVHKNIVYVLVRVGFLKVAVLEARLSQGKLRDGLRRINESLVEDRVVEGLRQMTLDEDEADDMLFFKRKKRLGKYDLLPCPFCGRDTIECHYINDKGEPRVSLECSNKKCGIGQTRAFPNIDKARRAWNRRRK